MTWRYSILVSLLRLLVLGLLGMGVVWFFHYLGYMQGQLSEDDAPAGRAGTSSVVGVYGPPVSEYHLAAGLLQEDGDLGYVYDDDWWRAPLPEIFNPSLDWRQQAQRHFARQGSADDVVNEGATNPVFSVPASVAGTGTGTGTEASESQQIADGRWIALVIDDVGILKSPIRQLHSLEIPLTLALLPYARGLQEIAQDSLQRGYDVLVHVPMEPHSSKHNPGRMALRVDMDTDDILARLHWNLSRFSGYVGINNHMGSRFTEDSDRMALVMREMKRRGLLFLDSLTSGGSVGDALAARYGVPALRRDVFIDDEPTPETVSRALRQVEELADKKGWVVAIAHPLPLTLRLLDVWVREIRGQGYRFVTISQMAALLGLGQDGQDERLPAGGSASPSVARKGKEALSRSALGDIDGNADGNADGVLLRTTVRLPDASPAQRPSASVSGKEIQLLTRREERQDSLPAQDRSVSRYGWPVPSSGEGNTAQSSASASAPSSASSSLFLLSQEDGAASWPDTSLAPRPDIARTGAAVHRASDSSSTGGSLR